MEEQIKKLSKAVETFTPEEQDISDFTQVAQNIAKIALGSFKGELLKKALTISMAIIEFEDELHLRKEE